MTATCKTCRWFSTWPASEGTGRCESFRVRSIASPALDDMPGDDEILARGQHEDPLILVGPNFGCIHHEPKELNNG